MKAGVLFNQILEPWPQIEWGMHSVLKEYKLPQYHLQEVYFIFEEPKFSLHSLSVKFSKSKL